MPKKKLNITGKDQRRRRAVQQRQRRERQNEEEAVETRTAEAERRRLRRDEASEEDIVRRANEDAKRHSNLRTKETKDEANRRRIQDSEHHRFVRSQEKMDNREDRLRNKRLRLTRTTFHNIGRSGVAVSQHDCGLMSGCCQLCGGLFFVEERNTRGKYMRCCHNGKIIEAEKNYPQELRRLMDGSNALSAHFKKHIRTYNSALSFASMGAEVTPPSGAGPYCFRIHGQIYHRTGHLHPPRPGKEKFAQMYVLDSEEALRQRMGYAENSSCNPELMKQLDAVIRRVNPYAQAYRMLHEVEQEVLQQEGQRAAANIRMYITEERTESGQNKGRYNVPKANEIAMIFRTEDGVPPTNRDICIYPKGDRLCNISTLNPNCEPMTYVLFFPFGESGFRSGNDFTELQFYSHRLTTRKDVFNPILYGGKLLQQYVVDAYVKVEGHRLNFIRLNQKNLRVESYLGLADHVNASATEAGAKAGIPVILPSSFIGSPRAMQQNFQDAMAIVRDFGKPDLFLTLTCNPKWSEITNNLFFGQKPHDRPDLVARVFDIKKKALLEDVTKNGVLGRTVADIHVIEFQKRGLPHMHLLVILAEEEKIRDPEIIDSVVCAELPDATSDAQLHAIVTSTMLHGPCGVLNPRAPCMVDGACSKGYPKQFRNETVDNIDGYPMYRRRDNGNCITIKDCVLDNRWVVPYNPYLTKKYNAHINVEVCSSIKSVKYIFKYVYKGHDAARIVLEQSGDATLIWDEVKSFLNTRYVSAPEGIWRLFEKKMHDKSHSIIRLPVHLENLQPIYFAETEEREALEKAARRNTMLTGWFQLNTTFPEANGYLYAEIPKHFTWKNSSWHRRVKLGDGILSRMYSVSPKDIEKYHLRLLLSHVPGAKSFTDLRTHENVEYPTFKEACRARQLLEDDGEWKRCMTEASTFQMPSQLRQLFCFICVFCNPTDPTALLNEFRESLSEDFARSYSLEDSFSLALRCIEDQLKVHNASLAAFGLPQPTNEIAVTTNAPLYDVQFEMQQGEQMKEMLNPEQKVIFDTVLDAVKSGNPHCPKTFCVNAFAGAGKTFLFKAILHAVRGMGNVAVPVAWTGIAAALLAGGRTVHSTFKLPVPVSENSSCHIRQDSFEGRHLKIAKIFIWDECTMTPHHALEAVDRLMRDLTAQDVPFGGKTILLGGDWRQTLPVVPHGNRTLAVENCLKNSFLWKHFKQFTLSTNMRLRPEEHEFSKWLLQLGDGLLQNDSGLSRDVIEIPTSCVVKGSIVDEIFGCKECSSEDLADKAILCPKNDEALKLNEEILSRFPGQIYTFHSADSVSCDDEEEQGNYQLDFIHSLTPSGMPPHCLNLKIGVIIMLLRNLMPSLGLCNGTRLIVKRISRNVLDCEVISGQNAGSRVFIPRIQLSPSDSNLPFQLSRRQFPIRLSFCMTISKSQGQTLRKVGIYLPQPVFSHGMLYVAFSRCSSMNSVRVSVKDTKKQGRLIADKRRVFTENVVCREVLQ